MKIEIPYGNRHLTAELPDSYPVEYVMPKAQTAAADPAALVRYAVYNPLGDVTPPRAGQTVAIAINDKTRPVPHAHLLPPLLAGHASRGRPRRRCALSSSRPVPIRAWSRPNTASILPPKIVDAYRVICHDATDKTNLTFLGDSGRGTPVFISSHYMDADYRIVIGNIEPHQFQGFSGGVKTAAIGLAGTETINHNHAMMREPGAMLGEFERNPARQDVEEIGRMIGIDFAVNAILNRDKQIIKAYAGDPYAVIEAGMPDVRALNEVPVDAPFDLMIVSPGGHPKDINIYQSQKGMAHAASVTKEGGKMILCAACPEGSGNIDYATWVLNPRIRTHEDVFERFAEDGFQVGRHKAFQVSRDASRIHTTLVSDLDADFVRGLLLHPALDLQMAIDRALETLPGEARIGVMPAANATMPLLHSI